MAKLYFNGPTSPFVNTSGANTGTLYDSPEIAAGALTPDISFGSGVKTTVRMNSVQYGDGYEQRSLDGINNLPLHLTFSFTNRSLAVIKEIENFFKGGSTILSSSLGGGTYVYDRTPEEYFFYTAPEPYNDVVRKWVVKEWIVTANESNNYTISGEWIECFDP